MNRLAFNLTRLGRFRHVAAQAAVVLLLAAPVGLHAQEPPKPDFGAIRALAESGNGLAQATLGGALLAGRGIAKDEAKGIEWIMASVAQREPMGIYLLGYAQLVGVGVPKDPNGGAARLRDAAGMGFVPAQNLLAQLLYRGEVVNRDDAEAVKWAQASADSGNPEGQRLLGAFHMAGRGVPQDLAKAEELFRKSAAQGDELARSMLQTVADARNAATSPQALAQSIQFVRQNAEAGQAMAQYQLSLLYETGDGGLPKDQKLAAQWELKAAEQGLPEALGAHGMRLALDRGGVKGDFWKGYSYLYRAGALGHLPSQRLMGLLYQDGTGVKKDVILSLIWFNVAVAAGDVRSKELREKTLSQATPRQVAEAERRASAWLKRPPMERTTPEGAP